MLQNVKESKSDQPKIQCDLLESENKWYGTIEIIFDCEAQSSDSYWVTLGERYERYTQALKNVARPFDPNLELDCHWTSADQDQLSTELTRVLADCRYTDMEYNSKGIRIRNCSPVYRNESLSVAHQSRRRRIGIIHNHAWALLFWKLKIGPLLDRHPDRGIHIIHIDYHSDLGSPRMAFDQNSKMLKNYFTGELVSLSNSDHIATAVHSTAVGPGSFILPFLYENRNRKCNLDLVVPMLPSYDGDRFDESEWSVETSGPRMPGTTGSTLQLVPASHGHSSPVKIRCSTAPDLDLNLNFIDDFVLIDIDLDFFSNQLKGCTDWKNEPGWNPDANALRALLDSIAEMLNNMLKIGTPDAITVSLSPDFCPQEVGTRALGVINQVFTEARLFER